MLNIHYKLIYLCTSSNILNTNLHLCVLCACLRPHLIHQCADQFGFKDVSQRDPVEKTQKCLQGGMDQGGILGILLRCTQQHKNQLKNKHWCVTDDKKECTIQGKR